MTKEDAKLVPMASVGLAVGVWNEFVKPNPSLSMWACIGAAVVAYEVAAPEGHLLSEAAHRGVDKHPLLTRAAIGYTAAHLCRIIPPDYDLFHKLAKLR